MTLSEMQYQCVAGETFDSVALVVYGDEKYACEILSANPELCTKTIFTGGELLELPVVEIPDDDGDEEEEVIMPETAPWKE